MIAPATKACVGRRQAVGLCYRVLLWEESALSPEGLFFWRARRRELLAAMREAGIKGSRGKLAELTQQMADLTRSSIDEPLAAEAEQRRCSLPPALPDTLRNDESVLACRLSACSAEILCELNAENEDLDAAIQRWAAALPFTPGAERVIEALSRDAAAQLQAACRREAAEQDELGLNDTPDEEADTAASAFRHVTVLAQEAVDALAPAPGRVFVDATLGGGGHSERLLAAGAEVWGIDQDPAARRAARKRLAAYGERLHIIAGNFRNAVELLRARAVTSVDGLLADIGISSPQVDCPERGFSFLHDGPLDMRMDPENPRCAADIVNQASESELADILREYGEEHAARAIARRIVLHREQSPITTTKQLADLIADVLPRKGRQHPATRSFQALRIAVNDELGALDELLRTGLSLLRSGGRFAVITFHSLEDRAVKRFFERVTKAEIDRPEWPAPRPNPDYCAKLVFRRPVTASDDELKRNPRARSAKLRVIEKL